MQGNTVEALQLGGSVMASDLSMWALFLRADIVVKIVMALLVLASVWCWAIIFEKWIRLRRVASQAEKFEDTFWSGGSLDDLYERVATDPKHPMERVFAAAMREWKRSSARGLSHDSAMRAGIRERVGQIMHVTLTREMDRLERYLGFLATVGSAAPFVGLFGTVWGIMNSFQAIALTKNTNLAVVAPGIAEALFATALGLVAAIPAVIAYNKFAYDLARYGGRMEGFAGEFSALLSRQLDERRDH